MTRRPTSQPTSHDVKRRIKALSAQDEALDACLAADYAPDAAPRPEKRSLWARLTGKRSPFDIEPARITAVLAGVRTRHDTRAERPFQPTMKPPFAMPEGLSQVADKTRD